ncbi:type II secretion system GspH family protein [Stieleria sp. TO1_6]|uniref:PulJ/GspJ family protein n=1 Tax=Stieleria tagensis TaxID=2956795 RepID=UPI00209A7D3B|nr:type II secretion system protein [Stieleria tagensis]MCO8125394.1 type II secretion system GspH family protein [Stieleria tagensis]
MSQSNAMLRGRRSGYTLVEIVLVLALMSSFLGATVGLLSLARDSNQLAQQNLLQRQELRRFADDVRRDVWTAKSSSLSDGQLVLTSDSSDSRIVYEVESESSIRRRVENDDDPQRIEDQYRFGDPIRIEVVRQEAFNAIQWTFTDAARLEDPIQIIAAMRSEK